jgi:hypothetical protein
MPKWSSKLQALIATTLATAETLTVSVSFGAESLLKTAAQLRRDETT